MNLTMSDLKKCCEAAGFTEVKTVLSSGNVAFNSRSASPAAIEAKAEAAMETVLGRRFHTIVRATSSLQVLIESDPYQSHDLPAEAKRVVTFLREPRKAKLSLPIELDGATILKIKGGEIFSAYIPNLHSPVFMTLIEKTFGKEVTTRTWGTLQKCAKA